MHRYIIPACILGIVFMGFALAQGDKKADKKKSKEPSKKTSEPVETNDVHEFMQMKLDHSKGILEGLVVEDYDKIAKNAQDLSLLSQAASWQVLQTPDYLQHSLEFRRSADTLTEAAKKKNLDGSALAFMEVTMKCVNCHKYVRNVKMANLRLPDDERLFAFMSK